MIFLFIMKTTKMKSSSINVSPSQIPTPNSHSDAGPSTWYYDDEDDQITRSSVDHDNETYTEHESSRQTDFEKSDKDRDRESGFYFTITRMNSTSWPSKRNHKGSDSDTIYTVNDSPLKSVEIMAYSTNTSSEAEKSESEKTDIER